MPRTDWPIARCGGRLRRRRVSNAGRDVLSVRRSQIGRADRRRSGRAGGEERRPRRDARVTGSPASCTAASATCCKTTTARLRPSTPSRPGSIIPASVRNTATGTTPAGCGTRTCRDAEALKAFHLCSRLEGILPALETAHAVVETLRIAAIRPKTDVVVVCFSGRGDKDCAEVARLTAAGNRH